MARLVDRKDRIILGASGEQLVTNGNVAKPGAQDSAMHRTEACATHVSSLFR